MTTTTLELDAIAEGDELPGLTFDVSLATLSKDVAGTRDINQIHHDPEFARNNGARNIFLNTMWYQGILGRFVTDWAGPNAFVRKLSFDMRGTNCPGDRLQLRGSVVAVTRTEGVVLADLDVRIDNQIQADTVIARITVEIA